MQITKIIIIFCNTYVDDGDSDAEQFSDFAIIVRTHEQEVERCLLFFLLAVCRLKSCPHHHPSMSHWLSSSSSWAAVWKTGRSNSSASAIALFLISCRWSWSAGLIGWASQGTPEALFKGWCDGRWHYNRRAIRTYLRTPSNNVIKIRTSEACQETAVLFPTFPYLTTNAGSEMFW